MQRRLIRIVIGVAMLASRADATVAAEQWTEVKSPHFLVVSNAGEGAGKTIAWQLEQIRGAIASVWPWAKVDLNNPLTVFAMKDETALKALAPVYWERKGGMHPATVWVGGADQNYLAIRVDVEADDTVSINPYVSSYFSYVSLILQQSVARPLPLWFDRGLAGVMSNTIVRPSKILVGAPIPWHLERLREGRRLKIPALLHVTRDSPEYARGDALSDFDAQSWALVHFLMFGEAGARAGRLDRFAQMVAKGGDPDAAFREALGPPEDLEAPFGLYISRSLFSYRQVNADVGVKREGFTARVLPPAEAAARRALFHVAMQRPVEAKRAIEDARKAGDAADTFLAEGLLSEHAGDAEQARVAFARAVDAGSSSPYPYYRLASGLFGDGRDRDALVRAEKLLDRAATLNIRFASAYALLAETRSLLGAGDPMGLAMRAIALEPAESHYRLVAAGILGREKKYEEALVHARAALTLADNDEERRRASSMIESLRSAK